jgi:acyl transferase domain-containing protein/thioesterase domain-containing protein
MACRVPGAADADAFWRNVRDGVESIRSYSIDELRAAGVTSALLGNPNYVPRGAPLEDMEMFDAGFFGLSAHEAAIMDPQHRHFLECVWEALEHAGHAPSRFNGPIGVFGGSGHNAYLSYNLLTRPELVDSVGFFLLRHTGNDKDFLTTRVSYALNLHGPSVAVQTACSTSLVAVHLGVQSLLAGECDLAVAGGVTIELPHRQGYLYAEGEILSPDGRCRAFDARAAGTVFGSGAGALVLRRLSDAIADGDTIYAVVKGTAVNNDGSEKVSYLAPSVKGQASAISEALAVAGVDATTISMVEAHGTGTLVGDPIEVAALTEAFRRHTNKRGYCAIGSVKTNIGHIDTAAGAASMIKAIQALRHGQIPPSLHFSTPNPACQFSETPFYVSAALKPWDAPEPRRAGVSSLGVGGTNAHVVLEQAPASPVASAPARARQLLPISARSEAALERATDRLAGALAAPDAPSLADAAWTLQAGRAEMAHRRVVVADSADAASQALTARDARMVFSGKAPDRPRSVAFMFAGGGTQHPGMGSTLYRDEPVYRQVVDECLALMERDHAERVRTLLLAPMTDAAAAKALQEPLTGLPALWVTQYAQARLWMHWGIEPAGLIGHSMGEYTAACLAGVFTLADALALVITRARLFETVTEGAMLSVPLGTAELEPLLGAELSIAAANGPALSVASGPAAAIERLMRTLAARGIETSRLRINVAAHSALLEPVLPEFHAFVRRLDLRPPVVPVASNLTGTWLTEADATDPDYWVRHLRRTVRFADGLRALTQGDASVLLEVGPGRTLATLARQQGGAPPLALTSMPHPDEPVDDVAHMLGALGRLWIAGVEVDWSRLHNGEARRRVALPTYPFERERHWIDPRPIEATPGAALLRAEDMRDWFTQPSWRRAAPVLPGNPLDGPVLVFTDRSPVARALVDRFRRAGLDVVVASRGTRFSAAGPNGYTVNQGSADDAAALLAALRDAGRSPRRIIFAWPLDDPSIEAGFLSLLALSQALGSEEVSQVQLTVLTTGAVRVTGEEGTDPRLGTLVGAVRVIPTELPGINARLVDVPLPDRASPRLSESLLAELVATDHDVVALRGPDRWIPSLENLPLAAAATPPFRDGGAYLITGGFGGLGLSVARHLAHAHGARIALVGRHYLPPRDVWDDWIQSHDAHDETARRILMVRELEAAGATVLTVEADVTDVIALKRGLDLTRRKFGALHGVFHAAGTLDDGALQVRAAESAQRVLAPKVQGTLALEEALRGTTLDFIVLFSSISALTGLPGQFDYAAANAFLDAWSQRQFALGGTRVVSINWAPWSDVGMAASLASALGVSAPLTGEPTGHPLLTRRVQPNLREQAYTGSIAPETHWLLSEHRVRGGQPMVPGTGFLALAYLADRLSGRSGPAAIRDVEFVDPLIVPEGSRSDIRVRLDTTDGRVAVESRPNASSPWRLHARARIGASIDTAPSVDLGALAHRATLAEDPASVTTAAPFLAFGPRWDNLKRIRIGQREALLELALQERFATDLETFPLHPALVDIAMAGAQALVPWLDRKTQLLVPLSIGTVRIHGDLPRAISSRVRYREDLSTPGDVAVFDAAMCDASGRVLVEVLELSLLAVREMGRLAELPTAPRQRGRETAPANPLLGLTIREGIRADEGVAALGRILASSAVPQVAVSPLPLALLLLQLRESTRPQVVAEPVAIAETAETAATPLEREIATLASGLLSLPRVGLDENLLDLGLHSLLAVRLFTRLKKLTGHNLPLATLLEAQTVRTLAARFDRQISLSVPRTPQQMPAFTAPAQDIVTSSDEVRDPRAHEHWLRPLWSHVVPLKPGGTLLPFFCMHARGGAVLNYRTLANFTDAEQPVYGIQCRGLDGKTEPFRSLVEMAEQYIEEIRRIQPHGPYFLGGGSLGGIVALEMAQRLQADGETIGILMMFDSWGPTWFSTEHQPAAPARLWRRVESHIRRFQREGASGEAKLLFRRGIQRVENYGKLAAARVLRATGSELPHNLRYFYVEQANLAALKGYVPRPYDGNVVLFRALDDPDADFSDPTMGWTASVQGRIEVIDAPGTHNSLVHDPVFGELFRTRLREAQQAAVGTELAAVS